VPAASRCLEIADARRIRHAPATTLNRQTEVAASAIDDACIDDACVEMPLAVEVARACMLYPVTLATKSPVSLEG
jgi:hypothetical protein